MATAKSSSAKSKQRGTAKASGTADGTGTAKGTRTAKGSGTARRSGTAKANATSGSPPEAERGGAGAEGLQTLLEQLINRVIRPLGLVVLTRDRIQETLDHAAEHGRITRTDANELVSELVRRGRQQTDDLLKRARRSEPVDRIVRSADRARRSVGVGPSFPILDYDELTAGQVERRLPGLTPADLRKLREYERRHANRKSVLDAIERALA